MPKSCQKVRYLFREPFSSKIQEMGNFFIDLKNKDPIDLWGGDITRIFVGIDIASGFYMVEGSTMLWDELCAFQGVDEKDLQNDVCVAVYINSLKRFGKLERVVDG